MSGLKRSSKGEKSEALSITQLSEEALRAKVFELFGDMETLRATLRELQVRRNDMSNPGMFETDIHDIFMHSAAFQQTIQTLQGCQQTLKALLTDSVRVSATCPTQYPELLRLNVEVMTLFSRLATPPGGTEATIEHIADGLDEQRQRSLSASI